MIYMIYLFNKYDLLLIIYERLLLLVNLDGIKLSKCVVLDLS